MLELNELNLQVIIKALSSNKDLYEEDCWSLYKERKAQGMTGTPFKRHQDDCAWNLELLASWYTDDGFEVIQNKVFPSLKAVLYNLKDYVPVMQALRYIDSNGSMVIKKDL